MERSTGLRPKSAVEMPGGGRRWETLVSQLRESRLDIEFPTVAHRPWKSPKARFPHSHSADDVPAFPFARKRLAAAELAGLITGSWEGRRRHDCFSAKGRIADPQQWINLRLIRSRFIQPGEQRFNYRLRPSSIPCNGSWASSTWTCACTATGGSRRSTFASSPIGELPGAVGVVSGPRRVMTACRSGVGCLYLCGESPPGSATRHGGSTVPNMGWWSSTFRGATASGR